MPRVFTPRLSLIFVVLALAGCSLPESEVRPVEAKTVARHRGVAEVAAERGGFVASLDAGGTPSFLWGTSQAPARAESPEGAAREHLTRLAAAYRLEPGDVAAAELLSVHGFGEGHIVRLRQRSGDVPILPSEVRVLLAADGRLVAISGGLQAPRARANHGFDLDPTTAVATALQASTKLVARRQQIIPAAEADSGFTRFRLSEDSAIHVPEGRFRKVMWAAGEPMRPAYFVEFYAGARGQGDTRAYRFIVDAATGTILDRRDLTDNEAPFVYRVWTDDSRVPRPLDGPHEDYAPHPTGVPDGSQPAIIPSVLADMEGFNTNPTGAADPWLAVGASETRGNNVDAYSDDNSPDGFSNGDLRGATTAVRTFDWDYDFDQSPDASESQIMASVVSLFYVTNWLHDYWYDSGFDEAAGNAQDDNFGRGGEGGDALRAEAQDSYASGRRNNANMSTPSDGLSPRMQMYAWSGAATRNLEVSSAANPLTSNTAAFGPTSFSITGQVVVIDDATGTPTDGCEPAANNLVGSIALIDRGACTFATKAQNAENAGAIGVILANNNAGGPPFMGGNGNISIGILSITHADGDAIKAALNDGPVTATLERETEADRDGSFDYGVVAHEWGHYLHRRLAACGAIQCRGMGEGWGDFLTVHSAMRDGDDLDGAYPVGVWATRGRSANSSYFGIRRVPYSVDPNVNALSFRHIANGEPLPNTHPIDPGGVNSQVHNTGEIWTTMLFEGYVAMLRTTQTATATRNFDDVRRRFSEYLVAGLMLTPPDATFTEARDAILAAVAARDVNDLQILAEAFARRGAGTCAVSPNRRSGDNVGVIEAFLVQPRFLLGAVTLADDLRSCDEDGVLDADERGRLRIEISNGGPTDLTGATVTVSSTATGMTFPAGQTVAIAGIPAFETVEVEFEVALDPSITATAAAPFNIRVEDAEACDPIQTSTVIAIVNSDETQDATFDDVESNNTAWTAAGDEADLVWRREPITPLDRAWRGIDFSSISDTWLASPDLTVSATASLVVSFSHRYRFEAGAADASGINWDGGVIETSTDAGATWIDASNLVNPGYRGQITDQASNPLALRDAFVATSTAWPGYQNVYLDFGTAFAGQTMQIRFRIGTDQAVGDFGWEIDNLRFDGIENAPFFRIVVDQAECPIDLIADAGPDQQVGPGELVFLDGSASISATGLPLNFNWAQTAGPIVDTSTRAGGQVAFIAPDLTEVTTLTFQLTADDGIRTDTDSVDVVVAPTDAPVANAGEDLMVDAKDLVSLDGTGSSGTGTLEFMWAQTAPASPSVTLLNADQARPTFIAPTVDADTVFTFQLVVSDGVRSDDDSVDVSVRFVEEPPLPDAGTSVPDTGMAPPPPPEEDGCGCSATTERRRGVSALLALSALLWRRRRRRS